MDTKIRCEECEKSLRVTEKHFGRTVKCPGCGARIQVPNPVEDDGDLLNYDSQDGDFEEQPIRKTPRSQSSRSSTGSKQRKKSKKRDQTGLMIGVGVGAVAVIAIAIWSMQRSGTGGANPSAVAASVPQQGPIVAPSNPGTPNAPPTAHGQPLQAVSSLQAPNFPTSGAPAASVPTTPPVTTTAEGVATTNETADLSTLTDRVGKGLVLIRIKDVNGQNQGLGSGFIISREGLVATNFHVMKDAATAEAEFRNGLRVPIAGYRAFDEKRDIAIVQLESVPDDAVPLELANALEVKQGSSVIAMGHPRGLRFTATEGIVSAIHKTSELPPDLRQFMESPDDQVWIQTSATIFSGNSGGPLLSRTGKVIGINSWITRDVNFGFALAIQHLIDLMGQVKESPLSLAEVNRQGRSDNAALNVIELDPKVKAINEEFQRSFEEFQVHLRAAKTYEEQRQILTSKNPARRDVPRLIKLASENAKTPCAYHALLMSLAMLRQYYPESTATSAMQQVTAQLLRDHITEKTMVSAALLVASSELASAKAFLTELIKSSPERDVQGVACFVLGRSLLASDKPGPRKEGSKLLTRIVNEFSEVMIRDVPIVEEAQKMLFAEEHLSVGCEAPEIIGKDADGNEFKLSDFRGKVVMLDFFANWCPHCTKMYPLERIMVEKQRDKPYILLGVNCDRDGVLQSLITDKKVTWKCWADGENGPIATEWQLSGFPMIYIIDHQGIIRYQFNGAPDPEEVEKALAQLVGKVNEKSKSGSKKSPGSSRDKSRASNN